MSDVFLNLKDTKVFDDEALEIDKKITFIFGKNGTGKSTLTSLFKDQVKNYDVNCFQGFDGLIGEDERLNAVILGEENNEIDKQIETHKSLINQKETEIKIIEKDTLESDENSSNLWKEVEDKKIELKAKEREIDSFYTNSARSIKNLNNPQVANPSYNTIAFQSEISKALKLSDEEVNAHEEVIKTDVKKASKVKYKSIDLEKIFKDTNSLLLKKVQEKEMIPEISGNAAKTEFAEIGLDLHEFNGNCSFCGNIISEDRYQKLERYFSADEVKKFRNELEKHIELIDDKISQLEEITVDVNDFYPEYIKELIMFKSNYDIKKDYILDFLKQLKIASDNKLKELFEQSMTIEFDIPDALDDELGRYNRLVDKNNSSDLQLKQRQSKDALRYYEIGKYLDSFSFEKEKEKLQTLKSSYETSKNILDKENIKIDRLKKEIDSINFEIIKLQAMTKNEKILADKINDKLGLYVNFELEYLDEGSEKGHYLVRCKNTGELRNITQLSSGEKNIIAFLYFIQKIDDVENPKESLSKLVIFDDPMTSNDDTMQYLIVEELNELIDRLKENDKIVIMTHNSHFYLNVKYNYSSYKKNIYLRLTSDGTKTFINKISDSEKDYKTNYEALWKELEFIYENATSDSMLLNPIRRIIETYTKFNCISKSDMYSHVSGAKKLFDVNSHSIDDLEAELNGKSKKDIMNMMKECFKEENSLKHFNKYCNIDLDSDTI